MTLVFEAVLALVALGSSLVIYFKFIDKSLDKSMDRIFAGWHRDLELDSFESSRMLRKK